MKFDSFEDNVSSEYHLPTVQKELLHLRIPSGQTLVLTHFGNDVDDNRAWGMAQWDIIADGVPVRNYTSIKDQYGTFSLMREIPFGFITATRDLQIMTTNNDPLNTFKIGTSIKGAYLKND